MKCCDLIEIESVWFQLFQFFNLLALHIEYILLRKHYGHVNYGFQLFLYELLNFTLQQNRTEICCSLLVRTF